MAGPYYDYAWQELGYVHQAAEAGLKFTYQLRAHPSLQGVSLYDRGGVIASLSDAEIADYARQQVEAVIDDPVANATVARWAVTPEEIRYWSEDDLRYLDITVDTIREVEAERGVDPRPVWNYQANNRTAEQLVMIGEKLDVITKGTYMTTMENRGPERSGLAVWNFDQILQAAAELGATPQAIFQLYEDFTDPETGTVATEIERVIRNDVYLALVKGITSLNVFSMYENRTNLTTHNEQFEAYGSVATDLTGELDLQRVFLAGEEKDDLEIVAQDVPQTYMYTDMFGGVHEYPTLQYGNYSLDGDRYVVLVNSTESPMTVSIDGLPQTYTVDNLFAGTSAASTGTHYTTTLDRLGVQVLRFRASGGGIA
ncbi:hypothetical protein NG895_27315 [Aeoliella sp. ICT_H6.2]|uniref:Alpha galactosidase C-terminal domain-containing protein n=1 Tax=Aeoliella straminimaris TaxID=2954799 RepID=A0A9X2FIY5_9BACT|nr:hypothetical protein [Aeoliella straminimaris]MCO6047631.1 hypothetical protein [Aeoliella straminimaris]